MIGFMESHPEVAMFALHAAALVLASARVYGEMGRERLMVSFGCTGGRHRSVYQAEQLATALRDEGFQVVLTHLDMERLPGERTPMEPPQ